MSSFSISFEASSSSSLPSDPSQYYKLVNVRASHSTNLNGSTYNAGIDFENISGSVPIAIAVHVVQHAVDTVLARAITDLNLTTDINTTLFTLKMEHASMKNLQKGCVYMGRRNRDQNTAQSLFAECQRIMQSEEGIELDEGLSITLNMRSKTKRGGASEDDNLCLLIAVVKGAARVDYESHRDTLPMVGRHRRLDQRFREYKKKMDLLKRPDEARRAAIRAGNLHIPGFDPTQNRLMDFDDIAVLDSKTNRYRFFVYNYDDGAILYQSRDKLLQPIVPILYDARQQHYELLNSPVAHFDGVARPRLKHLCKYCGGLFAEAVLHLRCVYKCIDCGHKGDCVRISTEAKSCLTCHLRFKNTLCFQSHLTKGVCLARRYKCLSCMKVYYERGMPREKHICGEDLYCTRCGKNKPHNHQCGWGPYTTEERQKEKKKAEKFRHIYYDFETSVNTMESDEIKWRNKHIVTHAVAQMVCYKCVEPEFWPVNVPPPTGGDCPCVEEVVFSSTTFDPHVVIDKFCEWLFFTPSITNGYDVIAHNGSRYDSHFILDFMMRKGIKPTTVTREQALLALKTARPKREDTYTPIDSVWLMDEPQEERILRISKLRIIDSCQFIPIPLAKFPATFGLTGAKGDFPIFANCPQFLNTAEWPDLKFFAVGKKSTEERARVSRFLDEMRNTGTPFNMAAEIIKYCKQDVKLLKEGSLMYRKMYIEALELDPFHGCLTLASTCLNTFKVLHNEHVIMPLPEHGYRSCDRYSELGIKYLEWLAEKDGLTVQHAENGGEYVHTTRNGQAFKVDGLLENSSLTIKKMVEINGCYYHGCPNCFLPDLVNPTLGKPYGELYRETKEREEKLRDTGVPLTVMWECEITRMKRGDREMNEFFKKYRCVGILEPRKAFKGGRTQSFRTLVEPAPGILIYYYDVVSLYPFINSTVAYPLWKPKVYRAPRLEDACTFGNKNIETWVKGRSVLETRTVQTLRHKGLYYCKVLPPRDLFIPILPYSHDKYLFYPLCRTCLEEKYKANNNIDNIACEHTDEERAITDTWYSNELQFALDHNYKILKVHEVYAWTSFTKTATDGGRLVGGLFNSYMNINFKNKQEASGWPSPNMTAAEKADFLAKFEHTHGIPLDTTKLDNPCKEQRLIAKLSLNNLWGRMGMSVDRTTTTFCQTREEVDKIWYSPTNEIVGEILMPESDTWMFKTKERKESQHAVEYGSLAIAIVTTSEARLLLTKLMMEVGAERICYCDTDSVMFTGGKQEDDPVVAGFMARHAGSDLGKLTNELPEGYEGCKLIAPGAKQYALRMKYVGDDPAMPQYREIMKLRGISQNFDTRDTLTLDTLEQQTIALCTGAQTGIAPLSFEVDRIVKNMGDVKSVTMQKKYLARNCKGVHKDYTVYPYGYRFD